jgi:carboxypeptidase C (cathepsin A)
MLAWLQEHGPYVMDDGETTFKLNPYSWNTKASVIYLDQPAGIGFSWCDNATAPQDCWSNDYAQTFDNIQAVQ